MLVIGYPTYLLCPQIGISLGSFSRGTFKKSASFAVHLVLIKAKAFTPKLARAEVKTWYLLRNKV